MAGDDRVRVCMLADGCVPPREGKEWMETLEAGCACSRMYMMRSAEKGGPHEVREKLLCIFKIYYRGSVTLTLNPNQTPLGIAISPLYIPNVFLRENCVSGLPRRGRIEIIDRF